MSTPQAFISFGNITGIEGGNFLMQGGVAPSMGEISCVPQIITESVGTLEIRYVHDVVNHVPPDFVLSAPNSVLIRVSVEGGDGNPTSMKLTFADFRYWWQFSHIDGEYNRPRGDGTFDNERDLQQLMALCLQSLPFVGELGFTVAAVDPSPRPHVAWRADRADLVLEKLLSDYGYTLNIRLSGQIAIDKIGEGNALPTFGAEKTIGFSAAGGALPAKVRIACGNVSYETKFKLEAVGEDTDGTVKPIDQLSYKPADGWTTFDFPEFPSVAGTYTVDGKAVPKAELARKSVHRWYRAKHPAHLPVGAHAAPPGFLGVDEDGNVGPASAEQQQQVGMKHLLPLIPYLNQQSDDSDDNEKKYRPAFLSGVFYLEDGLDDNTDKGTVYPGSFSLDGERGIVVLSEHVYKVEKVGQDEHGDINEVRPADLYLTCTCHVTLPEFNAKQYYAHTYNAGGPLGVHTIEYTEIVPRVEPTYGGDDGTTLVETTHNLADIQAQIAYYADAAIAKLTPQNGLVIEYQGIRGIELDGLRRQVEWRIGFGQASQTRASLGTEINSFEPTYEEYIELQNRRLESRRNRRIHRQLTEAKQWGAPVQ